MEETGNEVWFGGDGSVGIGMERDLRVLGKELLENSKKGIGIFQRIQHDGLFPFRITWTRTVLQYGGKRSIEERKVHETNAAQISIWLVFSNGFAETGEDDLG